MTRNVAEPQGGSVDSGWLFPVNLDFMLHLLEETVCDTCSCWTVLASPDSQFLKINYPNYFTWSTKEGEMGSHFGGGIVLI